MKRVKWVLFWMILLFPFVFAQQCQDGQEQPCGLNNIGECKLGTQYCQSGSWSQCFGAKWPSDEICFDNKDNDCDNVIDENCVCQDGAQQQCGPDTDVGMCSFGVETCQNNVWGACQGAAYPLFADLCNNALDDDCDGTVDEGCTQQQQNVTSGTCFNGVKDGDEIGIDCGGLCRTCASCTDGILNQGEQRIRVYLGNATYSDCGGSACPVCPSCDDGMKNQNEVGIDCGGECKACGEEKKEDDADGDGLTAQQELFKGTQPMRADTDGDGVNDKTDAMPLCPNTMCDQQFGEDEENCPEDCESGKSGLVFGVVILIFFVVAAYLYWKFTKGVQSTRATSKKTQEPFAPGFDVGAYHALEEKKTKKDKTKTEEDLEKSFQKVEKFLGK